MQKAASSCNADFLSARAEELAKKIKQIYAKEDADYQMAWKGAFAYAVMAVITWKGCSALVEERKDLEEAQKTLARDGEIRAQNQDALEKNKDAFSCLRDVLNFLAQRASGCVLRAGKGKRSDRIMVREALKNFGDFALVERMLACPDLAGLFDARVRDELRAWAADKRAKWAQEIPLVEVAYGMNVFGIVRRGLWPRKPHYLAMAVSALILAAKIYNSAQSEESAEKA